MTLAGTYNPVSAGDHRVPYGWRLHIAEPDTARFTEPELGNRILGNALNYIGDHPLSPISAATHNTLRLLELEGSFAWERSAGSIGIGRSPARVGVIGFWILALLALGGAFTRAARRAPRWLWLVPLLLALTVVLVNAQTPRFREPLDPFVILLAGCALQTLAHRIQGRYRRAERAPSFTAVVNRPERWVRWGIAGFRCTFGARSGALRRPSRRSSCRTTACSRASSAALVWGTLAAYGGWRRL